MKKFILKLLVFVALVVVMLTLLELGFRNKPTGFKTKYAGLEKYAPEVEILVLGHSHSAEGFDTRITRRRSYNMSMGFQHIYFDDCVAAQFLDRMDSLKCVIITPSYFHMYYGLAPIEDLSGENLFNAVHFHLYWNVDSLPSGPIPSLSPKYNLEILNNPVSSYVQMFKHYLHNGIRPTAAWDDPYGYTGQSFIADEDFLNADGIHRARDHQPHYNGAVPEFQLTENYFIYDRLIKRCAEKGVAAALVMFPCWHSYVDNLDDFQLSGTRRMLHELERTNANCILLDHMTDERFGVGDFQDAIHLNVFGAEKMTRIVEDEIEDFLHKQQ
ncbi:MAG: hypothetical protein MJY66_07980 [Bacteroidaceae bacterium]|nr:hypothetical protein [Bacteroidaceae bacterium]